MKMKKTHKNRWEHPKSNIPVIGSIAESLV